MFFLGVDVSGFNIIYEEGNIINKVLLAIRRRKK